MTTETTKTPVAILREALTKIAECSAPYPELPMRQIARAALAATERAATQPAGDATETLDRWWLQADGSHDTFVRLSDVEKLLNAPPAPVQAAPDASAELWGRNMLMGVDITAPAVQAAPVGKSELQKAAEIMKGQHAFIERQNAAIKTANRIISEQAEKLEALEIAAPERTSEAGELPPKPST